MNADVDALIAELEQWVEWEWQSVRPLLNEAAAALREMRGVPPREPTKEMELAGEKKRKEIMGRGESINVIWRAMYDAAQQSMPATPLYDGNGSTIKRADGHSGPSGAGGSAGTPQAASAEDAELCKRLRHNVSADGMCAIQLEAAARIEQLSGHCWNWRNAAVHWEAECAQLRADARRFDYLRRKMIDGVSLELITRLSQAMSGHAFNGIIDAAIAAPAGTEGAQT